MKDYGVIVQLSRSQVGLLHISEMTNNPLLLSKPVDELVAIGQRIRVRVTDVDQVQGFVKVSRKVLLNQKDPVSDMLAPEVPPESAKKIETLPHFPSVPPRPFTKTFFRYTCNSLVSI
jgi:predicted RNA-binding protein with RPS1 domain